MKKILGVLFLVSVVMISCKSSVGEIVHVENISVGNQTIQLSFTSLESTFDGTVPITTSLEIENLSNQPVYLPWGLDPGYYLVLVSLDSSSRSTFGVQQPESSLNPNSYTILPPGEKLSSEFTFPVQSESGSYNLCAEILVIGTTESDFSKPRVCVPIKFSD